MRFSSVPFLTISVATVSFLLGKLLTQTAAEPPTRVMFFGPITSIGPSVSKVKASKAYGILVPYSSFFSILTLETS